MVVYHVVYRGRCGETTAIDDFSHSHGIESNSDPATVGAAVVASWRTVMQGGGNGLDQYYNGNTIWDEVTVAQVIDPLVPDLAAAHHTPFTPPIPGLGLVETLPQQSAICVSSLAGLRPNGTPFRGRMYLPSPQTTVVVGGGLLDPAVQANIGVQISAHFQRLRAQGHTPSIWSRVAEDLVGAIDTVKVGDKVDTIRSRRNKYPESYTVNPV